MAQVESNHAGQSHSAAKGRTKKTKKQFVSIEGRSEIYWIHADDDIWDTKLHLTGAPLVCPDPGCHQKMKASQLKSHPYTKYLSDMEGSGCSHFVPSGGGGRTTDEHLWLQGFIRQLCEGLGYPARLEADYADIKVEANSAWAVEVQRVSTDYAKREEQRRSRKMKTLWLLPESAQRTRDTGHSKGGDPVFKTPAVRLLYRFAGQRSRRPEEKYLRDHVWTNRRPNDVELFVAATLWAVTPDGEYLGRNGRPMSLRDFLREVFDGERIWLSRDVLVQYTADGKGWAGWILRRELERAREAKEARRARRAEATRRARKAEAQRQLEKAQRTRVVAEQRQTEQNEIAKAGTSESESAVISVDASVDSTERQVPAPAGNPTRSVVPVSEPVPVKDTDAVAETHGKGTKEEPVDQPWWRRLWKAITG